MNERSPTARRKVLFLRNIRGLSSPSGAEIYLSLLARDLRRAGWDVHFLLTTDPRMDHTVILDLLSGSGAEVQTCDVSSPLSRDDLRAAKARVADIDPDIVHCMDHRSDMVGALLRRRISQPVVSTFQGWTGFAPGSWRWRIYGALDRWALARLDLVFIDSPDMARNLKATGRAAHIREVPNGIDTERYQHLTASDAPADPPIFAVIARINPNKGQMDFVQAAAQLKDRLPDARCLVVGQAATGDDAYEAEVRSAVQKEGLAGFVEFVPPVPHSALPELLARCSAVVAPSYVEGMSLIVLEAMAAARPVICYASGGLKEVLEDRQTGFLIAPGDVDGLAEAMALVAQGGPEVAAIASAGRALAQEKYGTQRMAAQVIDGYHEVLRDRPRPDRTTDNSRANRSA